MDLVQVYYVLAIFNTNRQKFNHGHAKVATVSVRIGFGCMTTTNGLACKITKVHRDRLEFFVEEIVFEFARNFSRNQLANLSFARVSR
jgi:hypothetical protein